ncbi:Endonuclease/exonuclease/phosphatase family domain-containing protein 1 [Mytilus coruscus]|uniref:Endonuclease/exonuclease/phosphatase family domain-containing protein 1 n=1 Tax=Mytilus coruscus TaxID=42192 RepID=A0A6J7ZZK2_MYTCO|nr:Endonuclease/exonuclease/phosphatase family domain-containing protein 1 [Mytilus coruscus]
MNLKTYKDSPSQGIILDLNGRRLSGTITRRNLSATFNMSMMDETPQNMININYAAEEEMMTLPGINRVTAQNIIEYRKQIGGFKKVEDLALVSGVGAAKLNTIRNEVCVSVKRMMSATEGNSGGSSLSGSNKDLEVFTNDSVKKKNGNAKMNINSSNVFQLMKINGVRQSLAENIVTYRDKKGPFKSIDDLVKVKGIGNSILSAIRYQVCLDDSEDQTFMNGNVTHKDDSNSNSSSINTTTCTNRHLSESTENMLDILEPFIKSSSRPKVTPFNFKHKNKGVVRIASWNVEQFNEEKANNPGVKEVICMTVLENGFGLIAFQELADEKALEKICDELNTPSLSCTKKWSGRGGKWKFVVSEATGKMYQSNEYNGFLYDVSQGITLNHSALLEKPNNSPKPFTRAPFIGTFKMKKFDCIVVSVHMKATGLANEDLDRLQEEIDQVPKLIKAIEQQYPGEEDIIILGDFNLDPQKEDFDVMRQKGYDNCLPAGEYTNISNNNLKGSQTYDHIWITSSTKKTFSGYSGVVREGLTSPLIPKGWAWGGVVSDHCPVWAELYTGKDFDSADLTITPDTIKFTLDG